MHSALETPDIVLEILSYLYVPRNGLSTTIKAARICLLALALSSKRFTNFALDTLWWRMADLTPLFKILSNFKDSLQPWPSGLTGVIQGPFLAHNMERFVSYASRIRIYDAKFREVPSTSAYSQTLDASRQPFLLPRLLSLRLTLPSARVELLRLMHPELVELEISHSGPSNSRHHVNLDATLDSLSSKCPKLRRFSIRTELLASEKLTGVYKLACLTRLELNLPLEERFDLPSNFLSTLPAASTISSLIMGGFIRLNSPTTSTPLTLPALTHLDVCIELEKLHLMNGTVLGGDKFPALQTLSLGLFRSKLTHPPNIVDSWNKLSTALGASAPRLTHLAIQSAAGLKGPSLRLPLSPLISSCPTSLKVLDLSGYNFIPFTQEDLNQIAISTPLVERLCYDPGSNGTSIHGSSLLVDIARTLRNVTEIELLVDITHLPPVSDLPILQNQIAELTILGGTSPNDPIMAARCLYRLFPALTRFHYLTEPGRQTAWSTTAEVLQALWGAKEEDEIRQAHRRRKAKKSLSAPLFTLSFPPSR